MTAPAQSTATVVRCPACGQPVDTPGATRCPLCKFSLGLTVDERVTGADVTPYSRAYAEGERGWWRMCRWVWLAGAGRLKHLAMMRSSAASRAFALHTSLLLALGLAVFQGTRVGWHRGPAGVASVRPAGRGWLRATESLWWNPAQAMIAAVIAGVGALVLLWIARRLIGVGIGIAHQRPYRGEWRMSAALLYSTAWGVPALIGAALCLLRPPAFLGDAARWSWAPADQTLRMLAGGIMALSLVGWWVWLIRLGATAPQATRTRVMTFFLLGAPLLFGGVATGWWYGLEWLYERLFVKINLHF